MTLEVYNELKIARLERTGDGFIIDEGLGGSLMRAEWSSAGQSRAGPGQELRGGRLLAVAAAR